MELAGAVPALLELTVDGGRKLQKESVGKHDYVCQES